MALSDGVLEQLAGFVEVTPEQFARTFLRAQAERDSRTDMAVVAARDQLHGWAEACLHFARDNDFLRQLLRYAIADQVAGPLSEAGGRTFADLCRLHADIVPSVSAESIATVAASLVAENESVSGQPPPGFNREAVNPAGFDCNAKRYAAQLQSTMRTVCRIVDVESGASGTGVLIAPHLVATAAHVIKGQIDPITKAPRPGSARSIEVRLNGVTVALDRDEGAVRVAEDWLVAATYCSFVPDSRGKLQLPPQDEVVDSHDVAILRLDEAPGLLRNWVDVSRADLPVEPDRRGLIFHHHPNGAEQAVSHGAHLGTYGSRFRHSCSSIGGSSGGPLVNHQGRLVGLHHGSLDSEDVTNIGGGGAWLANWWRSNPDTRMSPPEISPFWELRPTGRAGSGEPVIGFDMLQRRVWEAQHADQPLCAVARMASTPGRIFAGVAAKMLPPDLAQVVQFSRSELDKVARDAAADANPTAAMLTALADRVGPPPAPVDPVLSVIDVTTDAVRAGRYSAELAERLRRVQTPRTLWLFVNIGDTVLTTALSESLGNLYHAVLSMDGGRGKLVIMGTDPNIRVAVSDLLADFTETPIVDWDFPRPGPAAVERYLRVWYKETQGDDTHVEGVVNCLQSFLDYADVLSANEFGGDWYSALCAVLDRQLRRGATA